MENFIREPKGIQKFTEDCALTGQNVVNRTKRFGELSGVYKHNESLKDFDPQEIAYYVSNKTFIVKIL